jgi:hypothetical protein
MRSILHETSASVDYSGTCSQFGALGDIECAALNLQKGRVMSTLSLFGDEFPEADAKPQKMKAQEKLLEVHARLCREYECPIAYFHDL